MSNGRRGGGSAFDGGQRPPALRAAQGHAAQIDDRIPDDASAHPLGGVPRPLSGPLLHPSRHAEQVDGALRLVRQSCIFAITAVVFKAAIGFIVAHFVHNIPSRGQRKWRGMLLVPWVIPPAMSCLAWLWLFDPSYSAFNWLLHQ